MGRGSSSTLEWFAVASGEEEWAASLSFQGADQMEDPILDLPMNHFGKLSLTGSGLDGVEVDPKSVREYLQSLLLALFTQGEGFGGKRPFGNSGWQYDLYLPLVKAGLVPGTIDEEGFIEDCDLPAAKALIVSAISRL